MASERSAKKSGENDKAPLILILAFLGTVVLVAGLGLYFYVRNYAGAELKAVEDKAPKQVPLALTLSYRNKITPVKELLTTDKNLLIFWATWCEPCVEEIKSLPKRMPNITKKGYRPIFVNYDGPDNLKVAQSFIKTFGFESTYDLTGKFLYELGITTLPTSLIVDKSGKIVKFIWGELSDDEL